MPVLLYRRKATVLAPFQKKNVPVRALLNKKLPVRIPLQKTCRYAFLYRKNAGTDYLTEKCRYEFLYRKYAVTPLQKKVDSTSPLTENMCRY